MNEDKVTDTFVMQKQNGEWAKVTPEAKPTEAKDNFPRITLEDDEPPVTFDRVVGWILNALAGVGLATVLAVGGYFWGMV